MTDIFNNSVDHNADKTLDSQIDLFADKLLSITKEDGTPKYDSVEKALDALAASQAHIKRLEDEAKSRQPEFETLREKAERAAELEEVVRRMTNGSDTNTEKPDDKNLVNNGGLSEQDAETLFKRILDQEKQVTAAVQNVKDVQEKLVAKYGDKAAEVIQARAAKLGTTPQKLKELSASNPEMVLELFGSTSVAATPSQSSFSLGGYTPADNELKRPEKSLISGPGATDKTRAEFMRKIKEGVYKRHNIDR